MRSAGSPPLAEVGDPRQGTRREARGDTRAAAGERS
jgi:hypothetical protein